MLIINLSIKSSYIVQINKCELIIYSILKKIQKTDFIKLIKKK